MVIQFHTAMILHIYLLITKRTQVRKMGYLPYLMSNKVNKELSFGLPKCMIIAHQYTVSIQSSTFGYFQRFCLPIDILTRKYIIRAKHILLIKFWLQNNITIVRFQNLTNIKITTENYIVYVYLYIICAHTQQSLIFLLSIIKNHTTWGMKSTLSLVCLEFTN